MLRPCDFPHPVLNAYLGNSEAYLSVGEELWISEGMASGRDGKPRALMSFEGATRGLRTLFESRDHILFASPEGLHLLEDSKGLWRSPDRGENWQRVLSLQGIPNPVSIWGITEDANGRLFAGVYTIAPGVRHAEIFRSDDAGLNWYRTFFDPNARHIHDVVADPRTGALYATLGDDFQAGGVSGVIRSFDSGNTWERILESMPQTAPVLCVPGARLFGSDTPGGARIFRTVDDRTFETVAWDEFDLYFFWMRRDPSTGIILASAIRGGQPVAVAKVFRSRDNGLTWHLFKKLRASCKSDGSPHASNICNSLIVAEQRSDGVPGPGAVWDTRSPWITSEHLLEAIGGITRRIAAGLLLLIVLPVILAAAVLVIVTGGGPAFYVQTRTGRYGRRFQIVKLRTRSVVEPPKAGEAPRRRGRLTSVGRVLRYLSVDELPQLWNVLVGEMAFIGPRPHPLELDARHIGKIPNLPRRYTVLPGMTGFAQVSKSRGAIRCTDDMRRRVSLDLYYIRHRCLRLNLIVITKTFSGGFLAGKGMP